MAHANRLRAARAASPALCALLVAALAASCSSSGNGLDGGHGDARADGRLGGDANGAWAVGLVSLAIDPPTASLSTSPTATSTQQFRVTGTYAGGTQRDVTALVSYVLSPNGIGSVDRAGLFTTSSIAGGIADLSASAGGASTAAAAVARISVRFAGVHLGDGVATTAPAQFAAGAANTANAPTLAYPTDDVMLPPNIGRLEVQWTPPAAGGGDTFDVAFSNALTDVHSYTHCITVGTGCGLPIDPTTWHWIAESNRGGMSVSLTVRALLADGTVGTSAASNLWFPNDDLAGGIYYWTAAAGTNGIYRYDFAHGDTAPQPFFTAMQTPAIPASDDGNPAHPCTGCHALSSDGAHIATVLGGANAANVVELAVGSRMITAQQLTPFAQLLSYNPDATRLVITHDGAMSVVNASDLGTASPLDLGGMSGTHPEWAATGGGIVFTRTTMQRSSIYEHRGEIAWLPAMASGTGFGAAQSLVPPTMGENHYYPTTTPDGRYAVYNRSVCPGGDESSDQCDSYDDPTAELWMTDVTLSTHHAVPLAHASTRGPTDTMDALTNSWPRVAPFTTTLSGRRVYWVTFSSRRNYGLRLVGAARPQLWMVAIAVPDSEVPGALEGDPSFAPFWLPFQDMTTGNHIAQWTRAIVAIGVRNPLH